MKNLNVITTIIALPFLQAMADEPRSNSSDSQHSLYHCTIPSTPTNQYYWATMSLTFDLSQMPNITAHLSRVEKNRIPFEGPIKMTAELTGTEYFGLARLQGKAVQTWPSNGEVLMREISLKIYFNTYTGRLHFETPDNFDFREWTCTEVE